MALVIVLWALTLLAVIAGSFTIEARTETRLARNLVDNARARALADAGVHRAVLALLKPETAGPLDQGVESMLSLGPETEGVARRMLERTLRQALDESLHPDAVDQITEHWRQDGTVYDVPFGDGRILVSIQDEEGKIDLNTAREELLEGLFRSVGLDAREAAALVNAIDDFRDLDDRPRINGAEAPAYRAAGLDHGPKNQPFEAVEELHLVIGMTPEIYGRVAPALTIYASQPGIDPRAAPRAVLLALPGIDGAAVDAFLAARTTDPAGALATFNTIPAVRGFLFPPRGLVFTVRAEGRIEGGAVFVREAVIRLGSGPNRPFQVHAWRQGSRVAASGADGD